MKTKTRKIRVDDLEAKEMNNETAFDMLEVMMEALDDPTLAGIKSGNRRPQATDDMAQRIMDVLCENGQGDFLLLRDDEIRAWWQAVMDERTRERKRLEAMKRRDELRASGLSKLTAAERKALGI